MRVRYLQAVFILFFLSNVWCDSGVVSGKFTSLDGNRKTIVEGDIFEGKVLIWPFINQYEYHKDALKSLNLEGSIKLLKINKMGFSINNDELLEMIGLFVLLKKPTTDRLTWKNEDLVIDFKMDDFVFNQTDERINELIVLSQRKDSNTHVIYAIGGLVVCLGVLGLTYLILRRKKQKKILNHDDEKQFCIKLLDSYDTREGIEQIYQEKKKWEKYINNLEMYDEYLKCINQMQYKKNWTSHDLDLAVNTTKKIRVCFMESGRVV
ncbi:MAG: hypothetical protein A2381_10875 [Bdellovibrionales bacterium RIFOXYB1_FULL_37_110]|nr:MAG: hypothetical protein A2181_07015 [Bdellovibrionales bacterium RIFOXYA1_FULL_38_20]OFZ51167.1 MAG: hypothetical protein A2417_17860 [Bdellovibrionales bacterium RIFOXYC1_FULL_37_79]OFZ61273.1 MAG: hypothetical protein A2381_10875 [Bdellovibrionales bacterium RIFOXYB1_FULL_37_110]OFZ62136.1 MAG: hypothetical protein A2577_14450 [Bdellovibrionales bacterium RIFOXYD1_FULL_36_51]OFZ67044.1 MAG: hypothetical protein A2328_06465 [Bdellovibrionales bacterium RIFOXYB2_FULL_36_6]